MASSIKDKQEAVVLKLDSASTEQAENVGQPVRIAEICVSVTVGGA